MIQVCKHCQVPLEGARELDEGNGDICMTCAISEVSIRVSILIRQLRRGVKVTWIDGDTLKMEIDDDYPTP